MKKVAAIDIGSNAIRFAIAQATGSKLKFLTNHRVPIRLGADVFSHGKVSRKKMDQTIRRLQEFRKLCSQNEVAGIRAVGTSALRDAKNGKTFLNLVYKKCQIPIEIIDGLTEARLIRSAIEQRLDLQKYNCLLIDIGGGSVEFTLLLRGQITLTRSFPIGVVRLMEFLRKKNLGELDIEAELEYFLTAPARLMKNYIRKHKLDFIVGTGGNFDELLRLKKQIFNVAKTTWLKRSELERIILLLRQKSIAGRVAHFKIERGRADVIVPASLIILSILSHTNTRKILIPGVGLKEGLLWSMLADHQKDRSKSFSATRLKSKWK